MRLRLITGFLLLLAFIRCGQAPDTGKRTPDAGRGRERAVAPAAQDGPVDRHVSRLILTKHARCRMECRHITEKEIREVLEEGEINYKKSEPDAHPDPKYALEEYTKEGQHLRVVFAVPEAKGGTESSLVVVTCIELGVEWQCDCH